MTQDTLAQVPENRPDIVAFATLRQLTEEYNKLIEARDEITRQLISNTKQRDVIARSILQNGFTSEEGSLDPTYKLRKRDVLNVARCRQLYPDIFSRAHPYVDAHGALRILEDAYGSERTQEYLKELNPEKYREESKLKIDNLRKAITNEERLKLLEDGTLSENWYSVGEAVWMPSSSARVKLAQIRKEKQTRPNTEEEEDE